MKLLAALQKEAQKLTKAKASLEGQLNAISAAVKAFGSTLAADSANGRKKRKRHMSASAKARIAKAQTYAAFSSFGICLRLGDTCFCGSRHMPLKHVSPRRSEKDGRKFMR